MDKIIPSRWAADASANPRRVTSKDLANFLDSNGLGPLSNDVKGLVKESFGTE